MREIPVELGPRSYPVLVGRGVRHELARLVPSTAKRAFVVTQAAVEKAGWLVGLDPGVPFEVCAVPEGEGNKTLATVEELRWSGPTPGFAALCERIDADDVRTRAERLAVGRFDP